MYRSTVRRRWRLNIYRFPDPRTPIGFRLYFLIGLTLGFFGYMFSAVVR
jgi:hypothetical protein